MTEFQEIYEDNRRYSLKNGGPDTHFNSRNAAIDWWRHHKKKITATIDDVDPTFFHYYDDDGNGEIHRLEMRDFVDELFGVIYEDKEAKVLIALFSVYQLDHYLGEDLFDWHPFYSEIQTTLDEDMLAEACEKKKVSRGKIAELCGLLTGDNSLRCYVHILERIARKVRQLGYDVSDLFKAPKRLQLAKEHPED